MKISEKITWASTSLFGGVFVLLAVLIYFSFDKISKNIFYDELARTARIAGMFYLEEDELSKKQFQPIADAFYNLNPEQEISIYDRKDSIAFDTKTTRQDLSHQLQEIRQKGKLSFKRGSDFYHGLYYEDNQGNFVVLVKAQNQLIQDQLKNLILILLFSFLIGMLILIILTSRLSKLAYRPVRDAVKQVNSLNLNQQPLYLDYKASKDELEELFKSFNTLLKEVEITYSQQKNFVDFASHELKTPLAGIINQLEVTKKQFRPPSEYRETNDIIHKEAIRLQNILKNLLVFSSLNRTVHDKAKVRIDEIVWKVIENLSPRFGEDRFRVHLHIPPDQFNLLSFSGNETLLHMAFLNLIENAAKFSKGEPVNITLSEEYQQLILTIEDRGIGIKEKDLKFISQPFFRAPNVATIEGNGLGLSIAQKILEIHQIGFSISSEEGIGTKIELAFSTGKS